MSNKILIKDWGDQEVVTGEKYELHYKLLPFFTKWQINNIKKSLEKNDTVRLLSAERRDNILILQIEIIKNPLPLVAILAVVGIALGGTLLYFSLDKVYKIVDETPTGKWLPIAMAIGAVAGLLGIIRGWKS